ncbi:MAG: putative virulence factor [Deltaproteobacteria bacterium]|jgi:hypothetical protein|nr:putative virulence factor [Deltaproteobacteria bacterium]
MASLETLKDISQKIRKSALAGEKWLTDNEPEVGSQEALKKGLRRSARLLNGYSQAASTKAGVAVFGPSQAGKSTLISALAKGPTGSLKADFGETILDYLTQINPEGGNETTGLVTRFSLERPFDPPDKDTPVRLKLFTEIDIVKILANTYYGEAKGAVKLDPEIFQKTLEPLTKKPPVKNNLTLDDMEDLAEYVKGVSEFSASGPLLDSHFWPLAVGLGYRLSLEDRATLFSLLWGNVGEFTSLYLRLYKALEALGHEEIAFCGLNAFYEPELASDSRKNSVLHVDRLLGLLSDTGDQVTVVSQSGKKAALFRPVLSALIAEIHVKVVEKPGDFMDYADILDFPGYRAREKLTDIATEIKNPEILKKCFLRGKVAYLFERYRSRSEITAMLLCVAESVQNNPDLPGVINDWVKSAHGETPEDRLDKPICLFLVLTKFDRVLEAQAGSTDPATRWLNRYNASFLQFFGSFEWPLVWAKRGQTALPFNNIFWLLNPTVAKAYFKIEPDQVSGVDKVVGVREDQIENMEQFHNGYLATDITRKHIKDPEAAWRAVVNGSDGGAAYIIASLTPVLATDLKLNQLSHLTKSEALLVESNLRNFYQGGDREEERAVKQALFKRLAGVFTILQSRNLRFGLFLRELILSDDECHVIFSQSFMDNEFAEEEEAAAAAQEEPVDLESLLFGEEPSDSPTKASPAQKMSDFASRYRRRLENAWQARLGATLEEARFSRYYGFSRDLLQQLVSELVQGAKRLGVMEAIETSLRQALSYTNVNPERLLWKQSRLASTALGEFILFLGTPPTRMSEKERTVNVLGRETTLFADQPIVGEYPVLPEIQANFDQTYFQDWLKALYRLMMMNVDFAEKNYNIEENARLGQIIADGTTARAGL